MGGPLLDPHDAEGSKSPGTDVRLIAVVFAVYWPLQSNMLAVIYVYIYTG